MAAILRQLDAGVDAALQPILPNSTPIQRALLFGSFTTAAVVLARPAFAYDADGNARPWSATLPKDADETMRAQATAVPWWGPGLAAAVVMGVIF